MVFLLRKFPFSSAHCRCPRPYVSTPPRPPGEFCPAWAHELEIIGDNGRRLVTDLEDLKLYDAESDTRRHDAWHFGIERAHGDPSGWLDFLERRERGSTREDSRRQAELGRDSVAIAWAAQESIRTNQIVELMPGAQEHQ